MGENSKISWCDHTFNPWWGCEKVSPACENCYAEASAKRWGFDVFGPDKPRRIFGEKHWNEPLRWNKKAAEAGERKLVFCGSMCDVFEGDDSGANEVDYQRDKLWKLIHKTPNLDWLLLTKRSENIRIMMPSEWTDPEWVADNCRRMSTDEVEVVPDFPLGWPDNAWALATVENQEYATPRIKALLNVPAKVRGLSLEPLLGPITFRWAKWCPIPYNSDTGATDHLDGLRMLDWLIIGCERLAGNRPGRPCKLQWVRDLVSQGREAGVAVFIKQLEIDGRVTADPADWPEDLRVQEFPKKRRR